MPQPPYTLHQAFSSFTLHYTLEMPAEQRFNHYDTPHRCKIKDVFEYFEKTKRVLSRTEKHEIFNVMNAFKSSDYEILNDSDRIHHNDTTNKTRNRNCIITKAQVAEADKLLENVQDTEEHSFTWKTLDVELNTEADSQTVRRTLQISLNCHKRLPSIKMYFKNR